jgi:phosphoglycolate phosphatase
VTGERPWDLVIFDLDGTLLETSPEIFDAVNDTMASCGLAPVTQEQVNVWIGRGTRELLAQALAFSWQEDIAAVRGSERFRMVEPVFAGHYARRCGTRSRMYPGVREVLQELRGAGVRLAVVTNKESRYTQAVLDAHALTPLFERVVSGDTFPLRKPDPSGVLSCMEAFSAAPERTLFVGDSAIDVATARNAGVTVWALPWGYNMGEPVESCSPDRVIADFSALRPSAQSA